jgi:hypothetical protein
MVGAVGQWAFANGLLTSDGAFGTGTVDWRAGQRGAVWFLAGTPPGTPVVRQCAIKSGKLLFFPLVNIAEFNPDPICPSNNTCTVAEKRAITSGVLDGGRPGADFNGDGTLDRTYACRLSAEVDGITTIFGPSDCADAVPDVPSAARPRSGLGWLLGHAPSLIQRGTSNPFHGSVL